MPVVPSSSPLATSRSSPSLPAHPVAFRCSRCDPPARCFLRRRRRRSNNGGGGGGLTYPQPAASADLTAGPAERGPRAGGAPRWLPLLAAAVVLSSSSSAHALFLPASTPPPEDATFEDVPQTLSAGGSGAPPPKKRIQKPKSREAERCTSKCVGTCIQGGAGSPGEGPFNVRRPLVVFKSGFRSRNYCLVECSDICNLIRDGDDGP